MRYNQQDRRRRVATLLEDIDASVCGVPFKIRIGEDSVYRKDDGNARLYLQAAYEAPCAKTGETKAYTGRKEYLSNYMTDDEIIKTAWLCFSLAVQHETMEGFRMCDVPLFNPHTPARVLLETNQTEEYRPDLRT